MTGNKRGSHAGARRFSFSKKVEETDKADELILLLKPLWNLLHISAEYQKEFMDSHRHDTDTCLIEIHSELCRFQKATDPKPKRKWPKAPSERYRESQRLFSNLENFWEIARVGHDHRESFRAKHKGLEIPILNEVWQEYESLKVLTHVVRRKSAGSADLARMQIQGLIQDVRAQLRDIWEAMKLPLESTPAFTRTELTIAHLTLENLEFHQVGCSPFPSPDTLHLPRMKPDSTSNPLPPSIGKRLVLIFGIPSWLTRERPFLHGLGRDAECYMWFTLHIAVGVYAV
jgi:hypothetical protein